jgi:hypothetical protein
VAGRPADRPATNPARQTRYCLGSTRPAARFGRGSLADESGGVIVGDRSRIAAASERGLALQLGARSSSRLSRKGSSVRRWRRRSCRCGAGRCAGRPGDPGQGLSVPAGAVGGDDELHGRAPRVKTHCGGGLLGQPPFTQRKGHLWAADGVGDASIASPWSATPVHGGDYPRRGRIELGTSGRIGTRSWSSRIFGSRGRESRKP